MATPHLRLPILYQEMAELTQRKCSGKDSTSSCRVPHSCCDAMYCDAAMGHAQKAWDTKLEPTGHPRYPLMNDDGSCSAAPHLRPLCTIHTCTIQSVGTDPKDPKWSEEYWALRDRLDIAEARHMGFCDGD